MMLHIAGIGGTKPEIQIFFAPKGNLVTALDLEFEGYKAFWFWRIIRNIRVQIIRETLCERLNHISFREIRPFHKTGFIRFIILWQ